MTSDLTLLRAAASQGHRFAIAVTSLMTVSSIGIAIPAIAVAKPKDPAVQQSYTDCINNSFKNSKTPVGVLELQQFKYDCCIALGLNWVGGQWNNPNAVCKDSSGNEVFDQRPPAPPPSAVNPPGADRTGIQ